MGATSCTPSCAGTDAPIYLPAGQLLLGGSVDRVVAEAVWIPATGGADEQESEAPVRVPCRRVGWGVRRNGSRALVLSPWMAGPSFRALLRSGASDSETIERAQALVRLSARVTQTPAAGSLTEVYASLVPSASRLKSITRAFVRARALGFSSSLRLPATEARDVRVAQLGVEILALAPDTRARVLARTFVGHEVESWLLARQLQVDVAAAAAGHSYRAKVRVVTPADAWRALERDTTPLAAHAGGAGGDVFTLRGQTRIGAGGAVGHEVLWTPAQRDGASASGAARIPELLALSSLLDAWN